MTYLSRDDIKVKTVIVNSGSLVARATVTLFDVWEEHGWRIMKSTKAHPTFGESIWIYPPAYQTTDSKGKKVWKDIVYVSDRSTWELVHEMIYDAYCMNRSRKEGLAGVESQENSENIDEINKITVIQSEEVNSNDISI